MHPACVGLEVVNAATNEVLQEVPPTAAKLWINLQGGQAVYVRAAGRGEFKAEPMSGIVHLEPLPQTQWTLRKEESGSLVAGPIPLAEQEERLTGSAEVEVRTFAGVRHIRLPAFELSYTPAPLRVECTFADPRDGALGGRAAPAASDDLRLPGVRPVLEPDPRALPRDPRRACTSGPSICGPGRRR